jgi:hypothetical protein
MRTLLISFKDNEAAETFAMELDILLRTKHLGVSSDTEERLTALLSQAQLDAMVARPTLACECSGKPAGRKVGYVQTKRFHWWVHALQGCKRPTRYIVDNFISILMGGNRDILGETLPDHVEVKDNLDIEARVRVVNQEIRTGRKYTLPEVRQQ